MINALIDIKKSVCGFHEVVASHDIRKGVPGLQIICELWRRHDMEALSILLPFCEGKPLVTGGFSSQMVRNAELWCFLWRWAEQVVEQTVGMQEIW